VNVLSDRNNLGSQERPLADPVVRLIWREKQATPVDDSRQVGLSRSIVSEPTNNLLKMNL